MAFIDALCSRCGVTDHRFTSISIFCGGVNLRRTEGGGATKRDGGGSAHLVQPPPPTLFGVVRAQYVCCWRLDHALKKSTDALTSCPVVTSTAVTLSSVSANVIRVSMTRTDRARFLLAGVGVVSTAARSRRMLAHLNNPTRSDGRRYRVSSLPASLAAQLRQPCVNSHWLSQWKPFIFDPPPNRIDVP